MDLIEVTDLIVDFDQVTLARRGVEKARVLSQLDSAGASTFARKEVEILPEQDGILDPRAVDEIILVAHAEMQRLWETMHQGRRVAQALKAAIAAARSSGIREPIRIVDVGCGSGYVIRWLAAFGELGADVHLLGADYNEALIARAKRLAAVESLPCEFVVANAFRMNEPASFYLSTGVIHHFRGAALVDFFREQSERSPLGFLHFDARRNWATPLGAWLFHKAKMRVRVGQHDGYMSAVRAHPTDFLLRAAREGATDLAIAELNKAVPFLPMLRAMHAVIGLRRNLVDPFRSALGSAARALGDFE